jgi:HEPN domain-containing protein
MEQTAVEFLVELLNNLNDDFNLAFKDEIEQAKEMEKQQIIDAYNNGQQIPPFEYAEQYYNETFNK